MALSGCCVNYNLLVVKPTNNARFLITCHAKVMNHLPWDDSFKKKMNPNRIHAVVLTYKEHQQNLFVFIYEVSYKPYFINIKLDVWGLGRFVFYILNYFLSISVITEFHWISNVCNMFLLYFVDCRGVQVLRCHAFVALISKPQPNVFAACNAKL